MLPNIDSPIVCITGGSKRIGRAIATLLAKQGFYVIVHYNNSKQEAQSLAHQIGGKAIQADLKNQDDVSKLAQSILEISGNKLSLLVNNASVFMPTDIQHIDENHWQDMMYLHLKSPLYLCGALQQSLAGGCIINISDIAMGRKHYTLYNIAKAAQREMTRSLALEMAPSVRVNGIAPGSILAPETGDGCPTNIIPLKRHGSPQDIAEAVYYLWQANYITGSILQVDGGLSISDMRQ